MLFPRKQSRIIAEGEKTILRRFERADVDRWLAWPRHTDPLLEGYNPPLLTPRERDHYYRSREYSSTLMQFAVDDRAGNLVGRISLREINWHGRTAVLGMTFHPHRLGQGLGTDALRALLRHYFRVMKMDVLFLDVAAFNGRAIRCYEKCGFEVCGQRWGEGQPDSTGILRAAEYAGIRGLFRTEDGFLRPLLIDMVMRRADYLRLEAGEEARAASRSRV